MIIQELQNCTKDKPRLLGTTKACRKEVPTSVGMSRVASLTSRLVDYEGAKLWLNLG